MANDWQAFFLDAGAGREGQRFCIYHPPATTLALGAIVYVHPFAEEMNKSRRMAALQSRALTGAGYGVLQIDLLGCGDSSGDFGDATWAHWLEDVSLGARWMQERHDAPLWLWGLRAGCLLGAEAAARINGPCNFLFWQPATAGKLLLQQFLRLKVAGDMLGGKAKGAIETLKQQLAAGEAVEVAGYMLGAELAAGLEATALLPPAPAARAGRVEWLELSAQAGGAPTPASARSIQQWQQAGFDLRSQVVNGPSFWQTTEIEDAPALLQATLAAIQETVTE